MKAALHLFGAVAGHHGDDELVPVCQRRQCFQARADCGGSVLLRNEKVVVLYPDLILTLDAGLVKPQLPGADQLSPLDVGTRQ